MHRTNTLLIIIVIILLAGAGYVAYTKNITLEDAVSVVQTNQGNQEHEDPNVSDGQPPAVGNQTSWKASQKFALLVYPSDWQVESETYYAPEGFPESIELATISRGNALISFESNAKSNCTQIPSGTFVYGVSANACFPKFPFQATLGVKDVRGAALTQADLNAFGDFVLKNDSIR